MSEKITRTVHLEDVKTSQESVQGPLPVAPLVTFDLNLNNLQEFLNKVSLMVNKNSKSIQILTEEITKKVSFPDGYEMLETIALSIPTEFGGKKPRSSLWKEGIHAANLGIQGICDKIKDLDDFKKETAKKIEKIDGLLNSKLSMDKFNQEKIALQDKIEEKVSKDTFKNKISSVEEEIRQIEQALNAKISEQEKKMADLEVNTLWKIRDCENLLKTRVNEKFVWDALSSLEVKLKKDSESLIASKLKPQFSRLDDLEKELKTIEKEISIKLKDSKDNILDIQTHLPNKVDQDQYKYLLDLINGKGSNKYDDLVLLEKKIKDLDDKFQLMVSKLPPDFSDDIHKITSEYEYLRLELEKKAEKDPVIEMFNSLKQHKAQPSPNPMPEFNELWKFREKAIKNFENIDNKFERMGKALDLTIIKKALASKANEEDTKEEFISLGQRLLNLEKNQNEIAKEIDRVNILIKRIMQMIEDLSSKSGFALISKKSWNNNCLSCGRGDSSYIPAMPHVQGYDGKFYKADMSSFKPAMTTSDWKSPEENEFSNKSPISLTKLPKNNLNSLLGKDLVKSLSTTGISPNTRFRPSSARK